MFNFSIYLYSFYAILIFALAGWALSLATNKVSHADMMWGLLFLVGASLSALYIYDLNTRSTTVLTLLSLWAVRLCFHVGIRNGFDENNRYKQMRTNHDPFFWFKSIYLVFILQAVLAWLISISIFASIDGDTPINALDLIALNIVLLGLYWETVADFQLSRFNANPDNQNKVLSTGLWRYSRHPNYFGEMCVWWGFFFFALANQAWWAIVSPILVTILLFKVTGVRLLESTIVSRRPAYADYMRTTNSVVPGLPKDPQP